MKKEEKPVCILDTVSLLKSLENAATEHGIDPEKLYHIAGLDPRTRERWISGVYVPRLATLQQIENTLNQIIRDNQQWRG